MPALHITLENQADSELLSGLAEQLRDYGISWPQTGVDDMVISDSATAEQIRDAVNLLKDKGIKVLKKQVSMPVTGMSCTACAQSVSSMLGTIPGVLGSDVNYAASTADVTMLYPGVAAEAMQKQVAAIGYGLIVSEDESEAERQAEAAAENAFNKLKRDTTGALLLALPVMVLSMFFMDNPPSVLPWLLMALTLPVILLFGRRFFQNAFKLARHGKSSMDTLVALSTGVAFTVSVFNTIWPQFWHSRGIHPHVYYEAAAIIIAFILLGKYLEERAKRGTKDAVKKLMQLQPNEVLVDDGQGNTFRKPLDAVIKGDLLVALPGNRLAVDGVIATGQAYIDESMVTGEPMPVFKEQGSPVYSGTLNQNSSFVYRAEKIGKESLLEQIIKTVKQAQKATVTSPAQQLADKIASKFVPSVIALALLTFALQWLIHDSNQVFVAFQHFITVLIIACPCALGLATPTAIMAGVGNAASNGILVKDAVSLEKAAHIKHLVLDKTGTITKAKPVVTQWLADKQLPEKEIYQLLYWLESASEHPVANAVLNWLQDKPFEKINRGKVSTLKGKGLSGQTSTAEYLLGKPDFVISSQSNLADFSAFLDLITQQAQTCMVLATPQRILAILAVADEIKSNAAPAIDQLKNMGVTVHMLTGDNEATALAVAKQCSIDQVKANCLPQQKSAYLQQLKQQGITAMAGDGINDAEAMASADVSIAMGNGSDIAMDVAMMTIVSSDLQKIPVGMHISKDTVATIKQNLFWAFAYNLVAIPLATGFLYPLIPLQVTPMLAGAAMALSSVSVVGNSMRLKLKKY